MDLGASERVLGVMCHSLSAECRVAEAWRRECVEIAGAVACGDRWWRMARGDNRDTGKPKTACQCHTPEVPYLWGVSPICARLGGRVGGEKRPWGAAGGEKEISIHPFVRAGCHPFARRIG